MVAVAYKQIEIAHFQRGNELVQILRDNNGKWYVKIGGVLTQKKLNASEIVRYLANSAHRE